MLYVLGWFARRLLGGWHKPSRPILSKITSLIRDVPKIGQSLQWLDDIPKLVRTLFKHGFYSDGFIVGVNAGVVVFAKTKIMQ